MEDPSGRIGRRRFVALSGVATSLVLAGCLSEDGGDSDDDTSGDDGEDAAEDDDAAEDGDDNGNGDDNGDGGEAVDPDKVVDLTGEDTVEIELDDTPEEVEDPFHFDPTHARVDAGTTIRWVNAHNVFHTVTATDSLDQKTPSGVFNETLNAEGDTFEWEAEETGTQYYYCSPHAGHMDGSLEIV